MSSESGKSRAELLFEHIALYGLTIRPIAAKLFCEGDEKKCDNLFAPLLDDKRLIANRLKGKNKYYRLGVEEAARLRIARVRGQRDGHSIYASLAILGFCHGTETRRLRVPATEVREAFGFSPFDRSTVFVIEREPETYLGRIIVPGPDALPDNSIKVVAKDSGRLLQTPALRARIADQQIRFVLLVASEARKEQFGESFETAKARRRISKDVRIDIIRVIDPTTITFFEGVSRDTSPTAEEAPSDNPRKSTSRISSALDDDRQR